MVVLSLALGALAAPVAAPPAPQVTSMTCGTIALRMASYKSSGADVLAPEKQTLTRRVGGKRVQVVLEPGGRVLIEGHRVQNRYVTSWACVTGRQRAAYVVLGYVCAIDPGYPKDCGGEKEWFRVLDRRGRFADAGVAHDGAVRDRLNARLGIAEALMAGVRMTAVVD